MRSLEINGMAFTIKKVPLQLLLDDQPVVEWARSGQEVVAERIKDSFKPRLARDAPGILAGVVV